MATYRNPSTYRSSKTYRGGGTPAPPTPPPPPATYRVGLVQKSILHTGGASAVPTGSDEPGVLTLDRTYFKRKPRLASRAGDGIKQARIVKREPNRDVAAEGENRWFRGSLVRRRGGRWR